MVIYNSDDGLSSKGCVGGWINLFFAAFHKGRHEMKSLDEVFQKFHSDPKTKMSGHCVVFN